MDEKNKIANLRTINAVIKDINSALNEVNNVNYSINAAAERGVAITSDDIQKSRERLGVLKEELEIRLQLLNQADDAVQKTREWRSELAEVQRQLAQIYASTGQLERSSQIITGTYTPISAPASSDAGIDSQSEQQLTSLISAYLPSIASGVNTQVDLERSEVINASQASEAMSSNIPIQQTVNDFSGLNSNSNQQTSLLSSIQVLIHTIASEVQQGNEIERAAQSNASQENAFVDNSSAATGWGGGGAGYTYTGGDIDALEIEQQEISKKALQKKALKNAWENFGESGTPQRIVKGVVDAFANGVMAIQNTILPEMQRISGIITDNAGKTDSRLYGLMTDVNGLNANFIDLGNDVISLVSETRSMSLLNEEEILSNVITLVNNGIAFNIEQRALWQTMTDKIVSTFSVTNETLLRSIKLQQTELTDTYMGIEAAITRTLNSMYKDTQFLNDGGGYDAVWESLQDVIANTTSQLGSELVYQIEVWLGSLSSLGLSTNATTGMAQAINSMLTGNIDALGDKGKVLMSMAAANANMSFADLLVNGIGSGNEMNEFMQSMLKVLQDIYSQSKDNNVLLSEWGDILGVSISDWKAISNLQSSQINTLASMANYSQTDALSELAYIEDNLVSERTLTAERAKNLSSNAIFEGGWNFATSDASYVAWYLGEKLSGFLNTLAGDKDSLFYNKDIASIAEVVTGVSSLINTVTSAYAFWDPMIDAVASVMGGNFFGDVKYSQFKNTSVNGTVGDFSSELFSYLLNAKGYINYSNILDQSFAETTSKRNAISKSASDYDTVGTADVVNYATQASSSTGTTGSTFNSTNTGYNGSTGVGTQTTVQQNAPGITVGNASANPNNKSSYTVDDIYDILKGLKQGDKGLKVFLTGAESDISFKVNLPSSMDGSLGEMLNT